MAARRQRPRYSSTSSHVQSVEADSAAFRSRVVENRVLGDSRTVTAATAAEEQE